MIDHYMEVSFQYYLKNYGDLGECYPILLDLHNSSDDTQPHSIIVKHFNL